MSIKDFFMKEEECNYGTTIHTRKVLNTKRVVIVGVALFVVLSLVLSMFVIIPAGHTGVVSTFGKVSENVMQEGFNLKAPWHKVTKMDNRVIKLEIETEAFSSDLQTVSVNIAVNYRLDPTKSYYIIKNVGKSYEEVLVAPAVHEVMKTIIAEYTAEKSIANRNEISNSLIKDLNSKLTKSGISVADINIIDFDFSETYISAIEAKQVAEQQRLQAQIEQERKTMEQQAEAERKVIAAKSEAEAIKVKAEAEAYAGEIEAQVNAKIAASLTNALVEYKKIERWDGELPTVQGTSGTIVDLK